MIQQLFPHLCQQTVLRVGRLALESNECRNQISTIKESPVRCLPRPRWVVDEDLTVHLFLGLSSGDRRPAKYVAPTES